MPRLPSPTPRRLPITITHHGKLKARERGVTEAEIRETITDGRELATDERGQKGGDISKFYKTIVKNDTGVPISKSVVAVCEVFADRYVLLSSYLEQNRR